MWLTNNKTKYSVLIMLIDAVIINLCIISAYLVRFNFTLPAFNFQPYLQMCLWISLGGIFFFNLYHLYSVSARTRWDDQFYSIILAVALTLMFSISLSYISANYSFPRSVFLISGVFQWISLLLWRYFLWRFTKRGLGLQKAIVVGSREDAVETADRLKGFAESHVDIIGLIIDDIEHNEVNSEQYKILGVLSDLGGILAETEYDIVVVTSSLDVALKEKIVCYCYSAGKEIFLIPDIYEVLLIKADLNIFDDIPVFTVKDYVYESNPVKRLLDVVLGTMALIVTIPVMVVVAVIIRFDSQGSVIFKQERVTKGGKVFTLYKFRTMVQDAEADTGPVFAVEDDQRATRVGRMLRLSRLDELPQLVNVIKGDMSLVGPRPERPFFVEQYSKEIAGYENRHRMKPGITGIAQIAGKYNTGPREKLVFDLLYAKRNDVLVDLQILLHTVKVLFMRDKAS
jgi:exopolysaccharide biosynthesis polyprenyl glycosylphosphotransferase